ncbi:SafA/ExsA family spore coat assembly protein [Pseudalkalibacillus salsuginis]|uniref:SafA/ExsA family spore coat assembly protein n=1 Tax=Pseudalkalibacillus salsuginis TaxID=2910972 RepID=UPI001F1C289F|nr:SafA/ExsA family spore coat assembly protein [Pseudalkalibacillus salsuginis]MCF6408948.1 SafA/ExsA family spore coat assembly protein [Pseudalkalibacillus salsuginis]
MKTFTKICLTLLLSVTLVAEFNSEASASTSHTVQYGDTMWKIAMRYKIGTSEIINANPQVDNPNWIYPGQRLNIPTINTVKSVEAQIVDLVNQERAKHGLHPLKANWELARVARYKSKDMLQNNYFSHTSPTYGSPFTMMRNFGISYRTAGENIAAGQPTAQAVMKAWMNSDGHRKNILSNNFYEIGVGYAEGGSYGHYWTQMFITR